MAKPRTGVRSSPGRVTAGAIVDAALQLIEHEGFEALSMRKLAQHCGVGAMTLYGYFTTKEELLTAIAERLMASLDAVPRGRGWQDELRSLFRSTHRIFRRHPALAEIVGRQHLNAIAAFRGAERAFAALHHAGLSKKDAMSAFIALITFTSGFAQRQNHLRDNPALHERRLALLRGLPAGDFPQVSRQATAFADGLSERDFETGLDLLIRGIASKAGQ